MKAINQSAQSENFDSDETAKTLKYIHFLCSMKMQKLQCVEFD